MTYIYEKKNTGDLFHDLKAMGRTNFSYNGAQALMEFMEEIARIAVRHGNMTQSPYAAILRNMRKVNLKPWRMNMTTRLSLRILHARPNMAQH